MKTLKEIQKFHLEQWEKFIKEDVIPSDKMKEINRGFGKQISAFKFELEASKQLNRMPNLEV